MYNLTNLTSATDAMGIVEAANDFTGGILVMLFVIAIYIIMLMAMKRYGFAESLITSSFIMFIISGILTYGKILNIMFPLLFLALTAFTGMFLYVSRR